ncbi:MAG TPA: hypothetical protein VEK11_00885 [Thermoanaerobaculia bacterium]|nr:hypothetical protein [Thermoanaerobaculia bacterium]
MELVDTATGMADDVLDRVMKVAGGVENARHDCTVVFRGSAIRGAEEEEREGDAATDAAKNAEDRRDREDEDARWQREDKKARRGAVIASSACGRREHQAGCGNDSCAEGGTREGACRLQRSDRRSNNVWCSHK